MWNFTTHNFYWSCRDFRARGGFFTSTGESSSWREGDKSHIYVKGAVHPNQTTQVTPAWVLPVLWNLFQPFMTKFWTIILIQTRWSFHLRVRVVAFLWETHVGHQSFFVPGSAFDRRPGSPAQTRQLRSRLNSELRQIQETSSHSVPFKEDESSRHQDSDEEQDAQDGESVASSGFGLLTRLSFVTCQAVATGHVAFYHAAAMIMAALEITWQGVIDREDGNILSRRTRWGGGLGRAADTGFGPGRGGVCVRTWRPGEVGDYSTRMWPRWAETF